MFPSGVRCGRVEAAISTASRRSMPAGGRRSEVSRSGCRSGGRRSKPWSRLQGVMFPSGVRCGRVEAAISTASRRSMPAGGRRSELSCSGCRSGGRRPKPWSRLQGVMFPSGVRCGRVEAAISTASRRSMPAGGRRSELSCSGCRSGGRRSKPWSRLQGMMFPSRVRCGRVEAAISTASRRSMPAGGRRSEPGWRSLRTGPRDRPRCAGARGPPRSHPAGTGRASPGRRDRGPQGTAPTRSRSSRRRG